jgi:hypothetical protein
MKCKCCGDKLPINSIMTKPEVTICYFCKRRENNQGFNCDICGSAFCDEIHNCGEEK